MIDKVNAGHIEAMLSQIRKYQAQIGEKADTLQAIQSPQVAKPTFFEAVKGGVGAVNQTQVNARGMAEAYERGAEIPLTDVVLAMQKSSLAFEATLQVRNKVLKAYEDILNMPV
jgi:flagellar hook-basal body complex protein FliE